MNWRIFRVLLSHTAVLLTALGVVLMSGAAFAAADVRILIDVSGSMKQNDPDNLRVPAMRLVSELLPAGTRAGVWLFGQDSEPLIAPATVNEQWREAARQRLSMIHSRGLFTHIERALDSATMGWDAESDPGERHIVLLTDGMVDVSKNAAESASSRARILATQLQRLRGYGARVHAVALSENVDAELLEALTATSGGLLEVADNAERLQRIFLHMLEQTATPVTVPLEGKQFDLDASVSEVTLLIFRSDAEPVILFSPDGKRLSVDSHEENVAWRSEAGYDLITVSSPAIGTWRFEGAEDPDNRAVIVTDLAMDMDPVPGTLLASEIVELNAWMTEGGAPLERVDLIELVRTQVRIEGESTQPVIGELPLNSASLKFESRLDGRSLPPGDYRLSVTFDSGTFKREINRRVRFVVDPVAVAYDKREGDTDSVTITVTADAELVNLASLSGYVSVTDEAGLARAFPVAQAVDGEVGIEVPASMSGVHQFSPNLYFTTRYGRSLRLSPESHEVALTHVGVAAPSDDDEPAQEPFSGLLAAAYLMMANALLLIGFGAIWWAFRTRKVDLPNPGSSEEAQPA